jgi:hypothetical protein
MANCADNFEPSLVVQHDNFEPSLVVQQTKIYYDVRIDTGATTI